MMLRKLTLTTLLALAPVLGGCSSNAGAICDKRQQCFNDNLDTGECADAIDAWKDDQDEDDREERVAECAECVDDRTCAEVLESCIDDCFGIP